SRDAKVLMPVCLPFFLKLASLKPSESRRRLDMKGTGLLATSKRRMLLFIFAVWHFNGVMLTGATSASLLLTNVHEYQGGDYSVILTNSIDTTAASEGGLPLAIPPTITTQPQPQTIFSGSGTWIGAGASGTPPLWFQWQFNGTNLLDGTNSEYALTNVQPEEAGPYRVIVTNQCGAATSTIAIVTIFPALVHEDWAAR